MAQVFVDVRIKNGEILEPIVCQKLVDVDRHFGAEVVRSDDVTGQTQTRHRLYLKDFVAVVRIKQNRTLDFGTPQQQFLEHVMAEHAIHDQVTVPIFGVRDNHIRESVDAETLDHDTDVLEFCTVAAPDNHETIHSFAVDDGRQKIKFAHAVHTDSSMWTFAHKTFVV